MIHKLADVSRKARIGPGTDIWRFSYVSSDAIIGLGCTVGTGCTIEGVVGDNCRIQNHVSIFKGVCIHDDVFIGPNVVFTNVKRPRAFTSGVYEETTVMEGATIGAGSSIMPGLTIGKYSIIGGGSVVTKDVPDYTLVFGNPAREIGGVDASGQHVEEKRGTNNECAGQANAKTGPPLRSSRTHMEESCAQRL